MSSISFVEQFSEPDPHDFWRRTEKKPPLAEIRVFGDNCEAKLLCVFPHIDIRG